MFTALRRLLGLIPSPEAWDDAKSKALCAVLGKEHDMVMHAIIPFAIGGGLDLYYFPHQRDGFAIATKEMIDETGAGAGNRHFRAYEWCMFARVPFDLSLAQDETTPMGQAHSRLNRMLNALARFSPHASLNPHETMEFPQDFDGKVDGQCLILDSYAPDGKPFQIMGKTFGLMLAIHIHRSEMEFARLHSGDALLQRLKKAGVYPYSDLDRPPVA